MEDKIIFAKLKHEHYAGLVFAFVFSGIGLAFAIFSHNPVFRVAGAFVACGFAFFFLLNAWSGVPRAADGVVSTEGVLIGQGLIPWQEISHCSIRPVGGVLMLCVELRDPQKFFPSRGFGINERFNRAFRFGQLQFPVKWSGRSPEEVRAFVGQFTEFR